MQIARKQARARRGFTFIELLTVIVLLGILSSIALLRYIDLTKEGYTTQVAGELQAVRTAALAYYADRGEWPANSSPGQAPEGLDVYLPGNVVFNRGRWQLAFVNEPAAPFPLVGVMVTSDDERMMAKLRLRFGTAYPFANFGPDLLYLISTPNVGY